MTTPTVDEPEPTAAPPPKTMLRVSVLQDGQIISTFEIPKPSTPPEVAGALAQLVAHVGGEAVFRLCPADVAERWGSYLFSWQPPTEEHPEPFVTFLSNILSGTTSAAGWGWYVRRIDGTVHLVRRDDAGEPVEELESPGDGNAFVDMIRAYEHTTADPYRLLGGMFAGFGIPFVHGDPSQEPIVGPLAPLPHGAAMVERAVLQAAAPFLRSEEERLVADRRTLALDAHVATDVVTEGEDTAVQDVKRLAKTFDLHPVHTAALVAILRSSPDRVSLFADALEEQVSHGPQAKYTISVTPPKPTWEAVQEEWSRNTDVTRSFVRGQYKYRLAEWMVHYAHVGPKRSNNLARRAIAAMAFDWRAYGDEWESVFRERFGNGSVDDIMRHAVRPWVEGWKGIQVGNVRFGKLGKRLSKTLPPLRKSDTPRDFYRLLYLFNPTKLDFDDMYAQGLFGIVSPCHRFAMGFYFNKYELAAHQYVQKGLAIRTREEHGPFIIRSGIPGVDNGTATHDKDALRWFGMINIALARKWDVYSGNNFEV